jgi:hypothetical protein
MTTGDKINWEDLATLAPDHIVTEIAELKDCSPQAVRKALSNKGLKTKRGKRESPKYGLEPKTVELPKIRLMCKECGKRLDVILWNEVTYMAFCINLQCRLFRRPVMCERLRIKESSPEVESSKQSKKEGKNGNL